LSNRMKLCLLLASSVLGKTPHNREDVEKMTDDERKDFDRDILFNSDEEDLEWDPYALETQDIHDRLTKVVEKIDLDGDGYVSHNELVKHTVKALYSMDEEEAESEFIDADIDGDDRVRWNEYVEEFYGLEPSDQNNILSMDTDTGTEFNKMYARDKGRFHAADKDGDGALTLIEYTNFKNPLKSEDLRELAISWALRDVDKDSDGKISLQEFLNDYMTKPGEGLEFYGEEYVESQTDKFHEDFDTNGDGFLSGEELSLWMGPDNTEIAIEETEHLIDMCDEDKDGKLTIDEILENHEVFLDSDATEYGQQLRFIHDEL